MALAFQKQNLKTSPPYSRLMDILYQCANRGVKVYVLVYAECSLALTLNSAHSAHALNVHENIQVERHPLNCTDLLWSHHEKLVIIDQIIGYVGGLDLCWGRYDTHEHPIYEESNAEQNYLFPGIDYSNARIRDFDKVENYLTESCDRKKEIRMHSRLIGPVVADIARHFVERWNFSRFGTGSGITDIKQNASVSTERSQIKEMSTLDEELEKKQKPKLKPGGFLMGIINQVNEKEKKEKEEKEKGLIPEDENKELTNDESNIQNENNTDKKVFPGFKMKGGATKLRGKKKENNEVKIRGSSDFGRMNSLSEKEGYKEEQELKEQCMKNKEIVDEEHLYRKVGTIAKNTGGKLRGRRLQNNIKKIREHQRNSSVQSNIHIENNINSDEENILNKNDEDNKSNNAQKGSFYDKFVRNIGLQAKKNEGGWFQNLLYGNQPEEKN